MLLELGNDHPIDNGVSIDGPTVTRVSIPDDYSYTVADSAAELATDLAVHVSQNVGGVTQRPDQEAFLAVQNLWGLHSAGKPAWVWSDNHDFAVLLGQFYDCPVGRPDESEGD